MQNDQSNEHTKQLNVCTFGGEREHCSTEHTTSNLVCVLAFYNFVSKFDHLRSFIVGHSKQRLAVIRTTVLVQWFSPDSIVRMILNRTAFKT